MPIVKREETMVDAIDEMLSGIRRIYRYGKYREREELKPIVKNLDWFKNFGEAQARKIERLEKEIL